MLKVGKQWEGDSVQSHHRRGSVPGNCRAFPLFPPIKEVGLLSGEATSQLGPQLSKVVLPCGLSLKTETVLRFLVVTGLLLITLIMMLIKIRATVCDKT